MTTSEQLERETEMTRAEIVGALTELRERMTPGRIVDEAFDFARDGRAGQFVRNLGRQAADNPALQEDVGDQDRHHGDQNACRQSRVVVGELALEIQQSDRNRLVRV